MALSYFLNRKRSTCVVTFKGSMSALDEEMLVRCQKEILSEPAKYIVLNLQGLSGIEPDLTRHLTLFQQVLRAESTLIICEILPDVAAFLRPEGVVREAEV